MTSVNLPHHRHRAALLERVARWQVVGKLRTRIGTFNLQGLKCRNRLLQTMIDNDLELWAVQEARCDECDIVSIRKMFYGHGYDAFSSPIERNYKGKPINGLLTFAICGCTPSLVKHIPGVDAYRSLVIQINHIIDMALESAPMLIANMHLCANDHNDVKLVTIDNLLMFAYQSHAQMRMIGDWNFIHDDSPLRGPLLAGTLC